MNNFNNTGMNNYGYGQQQTPMNDQNFMNTQNFYQKPFDIADYVNGFNGAANYPVPTGRTGVLIDFNTGKMWIKSPGAPQPMEEFDIKRCSPQIQNGSVSREEFDSAISNVNNGIAQLKEMISNMQNQEPKFNKNNRNNNQKG